MPMLAGFTHRPLIACAVLFICLCVFMQMLGTSMTLWNPDQEIDSVNAQVLEGFSLPTAIMNVPLSLATRIIQNLSPFLRSLLREQVLFHPPNFSS